jgi:hypothetical protein
VIAKDKLGRAFRAGDFIAYGHALGRCAGLRIGKVLAIRQAPTETWRDVPLLGWRITVVGVSDDWDDKPLELCKKGTLQFPNRCLKLDPTDVPKAYLDLYERTEAARLRSITCPECHGKLDESDGCPDCGWACERR